MSAGELLAGMALLALTVGSAVGFAAVVVRRRLPALSGSPRVVAFALITLLGFYAIHLIPGAIGVLGKPAVAVASVVLLLAAAFVPRGVAAASEPSCPPGPPSGRLSWGVAAVGLGLLLVYLVAHAVDHGGEAMASVDMMTFHLPNVAGWIQSGSFWQVDDFVPYRSFGTYPNTSDVFTMAAILPFDSDFLIRFVGYPFLALIGISTYALARELTAPAASAVLFATAFTAMPVVSYPALEGLADPLMLAAFGSGMLFLIRYRRTRSRSDLVLTGIGFGISFGTKWYAPVAVAVVLAASAGAALLERKPLREVLTAVAALAGIVVAVGGFWLLRNWVELGNPVFPVEVAAGGVTIFDAPRDLQRELIGFTLADYLDEPDIWRHVLWPSFLAFMGWAAVFLWSVLPVAGVLAWLRRRRSESHSVRARSVLLCVVAAAGIGLVYLKIPYTAFGPEGEPVQAAANSRYVVPALLLGAALGAWAAGHIGRARPLLEGLAVLAILDAIAKNADKSGDVSAGSVAVAVAALVVLAGAVWHVRRRPGATPWRSAPGLVAAACAVGLAAAGVYAQEKRFNDNRYLDAEPTARWVALNAPENQRIGVVGEGFVVYPLFGSRLRNEVEYVGPTVAGFLEVYRRRDDFRKAIREGHYNLVVVQHQDFIVPGVPDRHERWLRSLGYELVATGHEPAAGNFLKTLYRAPPA